MSADRHLLRPPHVIQCGRLLGRKGCSCNTLVAPALLAKGAQQWEIDLLLHGSAPPQATARSARRDLPETTRRERASASAAMEAARPSERQAALEELQDAVLSRSSRPVQTSSCRFWRQVCQAWEVPDFPWSETNITAVAASRAISFTHDACNISRQQCSVRFGFWG